MLVLDHKMSQLDGMPDKLSVEENKPKSIPVDDNKVKETPKDSAPSITVCQVTLIVQTQ